MTALSTLTETAQEQTRRLLPVDNYWDTMPVENMARGLELLHEVEDAIRTDKAVLQTSIRRLPPGVDRRLHEAQKTKLNRERRMVTKRKNNIKEAMGTPKKKVIEGQVYIDKAPFDALNTVREQLTLAKRLSEAILAHQKASDSANINPEPHDEELWAALSK